LPGELLGPHDLTTVMGQAYAAASARSFARFG
jgi:hypothetical protein